MKNKIMKMLLILFVLVLLVSCTAPTDDYLPSSSEDPTRIDSNTHYHVFDIEEMDVKCVFVNGFENGAMWCVDLE